MAFPKPLKISCRELLTKKDAGESCCGSPGYDPEETIFDAMSYKEWQFTAVTSELCSGIHVTVKQAFSPVCQAGVQLRQPASLAHTV